ncbi:MAG: hypothetical protein R2912_07190 [Eubacteriales bacterium]
MEFAEYSKSAIQKLSNSLRVKTYTRKSACSEFQVFIAADELRAFKKVIQKFVIPFGEYKTNDCNELHVHLNTALEK